MVENVKFLKWPFMHCVALRPARQYRAHQQAMKIGIP
jgi:hypothetical protein